MLDPAYIVGLVDGEGCFTARVNRQRRRARVELRFSVKLRSQDKAVLDALQRFFGCGNVYIQRDQRANHSLCYRYEVQNKNEMINKIIPFFNQHPPLIASRKKDFELLRRIAELSKEEPVNLEHIETLRSQMHWGLAVYGKTVRAVGTPSSSSRSEQGNARQTNRAGSR
jgi:hypothetical protein